MRRVYLLEILLRALGESQVLYETKQIKSGIQIRGRVHSFAGLCGLSVTLQRHLILTWDQYVKTRMLLEKHRPEIDPGRAFWFTPFSRMQGLEYQQQYYRERIEFLELIIKREKNEASKRDLDNLGPR